MSTQNIQNAPLKRVSALKASLTATVTAVLLLNSQSALADQGEKYGIEFQCTDQYTSYHIDRYLSSQGIKGSWVFPERTSNGWIYKIKKKHEVSNTLDIVKSEKFAVSADLVEILDPRRQPKLVATVSKKEILLAMLHPGRLTTFKGTKCGVEALKDDVGVRQNTVAWAQDVAFSWPEGTPATWNTKYWLNGTPKNKETLHEALTDATINSSQYGIGCYTAAKMILATGSLDYYTRVKKDIFKAKQVEMALWSNGDPLVDIEPGRAWFFESTFKESSKSIPGKILDMKDNVAPNNFIPGDWIYLLNTDAKSYQKTGYEGSNAIYLGLGKFSDYYNDHEHSFSFQQKSNEVYQWRNGVFSRSRDAAKVKPLKAEDYERLRQSPENGGILLAHRLIPRPLHPAVR